MWASDEAGGGNIKMKALFVSDYYKLHSGYARVARNILKGIRDVEWSYYGWFYTSIAEKLYPDLVSKLYHSKYNTAKDKYGRETLEELFQKEKFDVVIGLGDVYMLAPLTELHTLNQYFLILYVPLDSFPIPLNWIPILKEADVLVLPTKWAQVNLEKQCPNLKTIVIPHGVNTNIFYSDSESRKEVRASMGIGEETFLVGNFNRNQPRKNIPEMFQAFSIFSENKKTKLFLHMVLYSPPEVGYNIIEKRWGGNPGGLAERYNLQNKILSTSGIKLGLGVSDGELNSLYNAVDLSVNVSAGEGFGLTSLESISAGTPVLVSENSVFAEEFAVGVKCPYCKPQPITNVEWVYPEIEDFVDKLNLFYKDFKKDRKLKQMYGRKGATIIKCKYDWNDICKQWKKLIDNSSKRGIYSGAKVKLEGI